MFSVLCHSETLSCLLADFLMHGSVHSGFSIAAMICMMDPFECLNLEHKPPAQDSIFSMKPPECTHRRLKNNQPTHPM